MKCKCIIAMMFFCSFLLSELNVYAVDFEVSEADMVLYTTENAAILLEPDEAAVLISKDNLDDDIGVQVTGITSNGYFRISLGDSNDYYVSGIGLVEKEIHSEVSINTDKKSYKISDTGLCQQFYLQDGIGYANIVDVSLFDFDVIAVGNKPLNYTSIYYKDVAIPANQIKNATLKLVAVTSNGFYKVLYNGVPFYIDQDGIYYDPIRALRFSISGKPVKASNGQYICSIEPYIDYAYMALYRGANYSNSFARKDWTENQFYIYLRDQMEMYIQAQISGNVTWQGYCPNAIKIAKNLELDLIKAYPEYMSNISLSMKNLDMQYFKPTLDDGSEEMRIVISFDY